MSGTPVDTALNLLVFAYIGVLVWLATRPNP